VRKTKTVVNLSAPRRPVIAGGQPPLRRDGRESLMALNGAN
jgi:hypothetical protein